MRTQAGKRGEHVRSDCYVELELTSAGGVRLELQSKVAALYGRRIAALVEEMLRFFAVPHARVLLEDRGALPFALAARLEAAIKRLRPDCQQDHLLPARPQRPTEGRNYWRRTRLYLPGDEPKFFLNAGLYQADAIILDLEDSVAPGEKDSARILVRNALRALDFGSAERMVRINPLPLGREDLRTVLPQQVDTILLPKCESAAQVQEAAEEVTRQCRDFGGEHPVHLLPIIESARGVIHAYEIATASERVCALALGLEDYTADMGVARTVAGEECFYARSAVFHAAKAAGVQALDSVYSDIQDLAGLAAYAARARALGCEGMGCLHPRQIKVIHEALAPKPEEIERAKRIVLAFEDAQQRGLGVVTLGSKMVDAPVVKRALRTLAEAERNGQLAPHWRDSESKKGEVL